MRRAGTFTVGGKTQDFHPLELRKCDRIEIVCARQISGPSGTSKKAGGKTDPLLCDVTKDDVWDQGARMGRTLPSRGTEHRTWRAGSQSAAPVLGMGGCQPARVAAER
jgi:hypothetical protein